MHWSWHINHPPLPVVYLAYLKESRASSPRSHLWWYQRVQPPPAPFDVACAVSLVETLTAASLIWACFHLRNSKPALSLAPLTDTILWSECWAVYRQYGWILPADKPHSPSCTSHLHCCNWSRISRRESHSCPTIPCPDLSAEKVSKTEDHITHLELQLCICVVYPALLHHGPKGRVIKIINVACHLHKPQSLEEAKKRSLQSTCLQLI